MAPRKGNDDFLKALQLMYGKNEGKSVWVTFKHIELKDHTGPDKTAVIVRATNGKSKISTLIFDKNAVKFQIKLFTLQKDVFVGLKRKEKKRN